MDYILGPKFALDKACIHSDVKLWCTWDQYSLHAMTHEDDTQNKSPQKKKEELDRMDQDEREDLETIQERIGKVCEKSGAHHAIRKRDEVRRTPEKV